MYGWVDHASNFVFRETTLLRKGFGAGLLGVAEGSGVAGDHDRVRIDAVDSAREGIDERAVTRWRDELAVLDCGVKKYGRLGSFQTS